MALARREHGGIRRRRSHAFSPRKAPKKCRDPGRKKGARDGRSKAHLTDLAEMRLPAIAGRAASAAAEACADMVKACVGRVRVVRVESDVRETTDRRLKFAGD